MNVEMTLLNYFRDNMPLIEQKAFGEDEPRRGKMTDTRKMKFIAHRGYSAKYPENTMAAFSAALQHPEAGRRLTGIELDVRLTRDEAVVVFHDDVVEHGGQRVPVSSLNHHLLVDAAKSKLSGEIVPDLADVFSLVQHRLDLLVEIKEGEYNMKRMISLLTQALEVYQPNGDVILHSFSPEIMRLAVDNTAGCGVRFGVLVNRFDELAQFDAVFSQIEFVHPTCKSLVREADRYAAVGKPCHVWTVNHRDELETVMKLPHRRIVEGVMTDDLSLLDQCSY